MRLGFIVGLFLLPCAAWAHSTIDTPTAPFLAGIIDPILNPAHLLALVSIGLFAGVSGGSARWAYPVSLLGATMLGGFVGYIQPLAEPIVVVARPFSQHGRVVARLSLAACRHWFRHRSLGSSAWLRPWP